MTEKTKQCTACNQTLKLTDFNDSPNGKCFKKAICKSCEAKYNKDYYVKRKEIYSSHKASLSSGVAIG